jgi:hypothetical protein
MLAIGNKIPEALVWTTPQESATLEQLITDGPILLLFYLFDWSAT